MNAALDATVTEVLDTLDMLVLTAACELLSESTDVTTTEGVSVKEERNVYVTDDSFENVANPDSDSTTVMTRGLTRAYP